MRKSTCTRLFRKGVDPKLIKEQRGHKSEAVILYKKSNLQQKEVSDMLSVLPREMEEIRTSQSKMLDREEKLEKKSSLVLQLPVVRGVAKKAKTEGDVDKKIKEDTKSNTKDTKEGDVKDENKDQVKPSVVLDKNKALDAHVPVTSGNVIDFKNL